MPSAPFHHRPCRQVAGAAALLLLAASTGLPAAAKPQQQSQQLQLQEQRLIQPSATLVQRLRRLLNLSPPLAVGGSRSGSALRVCLLSPWITTAASAQEPALAALPTAAPTLQAAGPLNEIQILRRDRIVWQQRASSTAAISGPIPWPLEPLQPTEQVLLRLRPRGAGGGDFAEIRLLAPPQVDLQRYRQRIAELTAAPSLWPAAIAQELNRNPALAVALAAEPTAPAAIQNSWTAGAGDNTCR